MNKWLNKIELQDNLVRLVPMTLEHLDGLTIAVRDGNLWELWYTTAPEPENVRRYIETALGEYDKDVSLPFVVIRKADSKIIGTTRYMNADGRNKRLEIGTTWYSKSAQRTGVNTACKYLLLHYAFENLNCIAVEFRTHWHNQASRKAIERLGAKQDGILRNHSIDKRGGLRDTVVFSILNSEWPVVKSSLEQMMQRK
ncbi:GNAT family N-acetyltransferase [bacterium SCSIO 12741]|nr:GNAT family N-acetyltransferase [bacterium SCSIO 12741]